MRRNPPLGEQSEVEKQQLNLFEFELERSRVLVANPSSRFSFVFVFLLCIHFRALEEQPHDKIHLKESIRESKTQPNCSNSNSGRLRVLVTTSVFGFLGAICVCLGCLDHNIHNN